MFASTLLQRTGRLAVTGHMVTRPALVLLQQRTYYGGASFSTSNRRKLPVNTVIKLVPQQQAWIVERFGKFHRILEPGLAFLFPFIDRISYVHSLKEIALEIPSQSAITQDNVTLHLDGVLYLQVQDPFKASYGVEEPEYAVTQLAQTTMRSEIGKMSLDTMFRERDSLNTSIVQAINHAAAVWGISCLRYEIRDIQLPDRVVEAMQMQVAAERKKRAAILESEGMRESAINVAEGEKQSKILASEAAKQEQLNHAAGEAGAIIAKARATAEGITTVAEAVTGVGGQQAVSLSVAQQYVEAFGRLAKEGTTILLPSKADDIGGMVAQALSIFGKLSANAPNHEIQSASKKATDANSLPPPP
eukprot:comp23261_c0_seq1/m.38024 comp23261_c0_seq1/g.38024  ORF comp23261_c0_seq1/g.38024 comp23261_c0_seq1/m.38024 type:complete len:361 (-) comp23261_c0_seq1:472-1554(-)